jgi:hypothetical protein
MTQTSGGHIMASKKKSPNNREPSKNESALQDSKNITDYEPEHTEAVLKQKIKYLEEELVRKEKQIETLNNENELLFKTALKNSEGKVLNKEKKDLI